MNESNQRIAKNTFMLYMRMFFTMGISLYTSRIILATLGVTDYGIYNVVGGVVSMLSIINNSMAASTQRFFSFELGTGNIMKLTKIFSTSLNVHAVICLIIILLSETLGLWFINNKLQIPPERIYSANWIYQMSIISLCVNIMSVPYNAAIIAHEKMSAFAYISILEVTLKLGIVYLLTISPIDKLICYSILMLIVVVIIRVIYSMYCKRHFEETIYHKVFDKTLFREMISFAGWGVFGNCSAVASTQGVNLLLGTFFSPSINAARGIAVQVQMAIQGLCTNFQIAVNPQIVQSFAKNELNRMKGLLYLSSKYSFFLLFLVALPMILEANEILSVWLKSVPEHTVNFLRIILCIALVDSLANPIITAAGATGKIKKYQIVVGSINLMILPISYIALMTIPIPELVFVVHLIIAIIAQGMRLFLIKSLIDFSMYKYFTEVILNVILVTIVSSIIPVILYVYLPQFSVCSFLIIGFTSVFSVMICVYYLGMQRCERQILMTRIRFLFHNDKKMNA